jgi:serine/threonine protein kinase
MGVVFEAEHAMTRRRVAVKILHAHHRQTGDAAKRFLNEAQAAGRVSHPNVVEVLDAGEDADLSLYLVLELLNGHDLATLLMRKRRLDVAESVTIIAQVLQALAVAHSMGIIHRDIKPENIFLTRSVTGEQHVKILDFGISKAIHSGDGPALNVTQTNTTVGTPHYMSPEQARGERSLDARGDIWAVGVVLYECLAGRVPFDGDTYNDQIVKVITEPHTPLAQFDVPSELGKIVDKALEKDRNRRHSKAADMLAEIRTFIERHREYASVPAHVLKAPQMLPENPQYLQNTPTLALVQPPADKAFEFNSDTVRTAAVESLYDTAGEDVPTTVKILDNEPPSTALRPLAGANRQSQTGSSAVSPSRRIAAIYSGPNRNRNIAITGALAVFSILIGSAIAIVATRGSRSDTVQAVTMVSFEFLGLPPNARLNVGGVPIYGSNTAIVPRGNSQVNVEISAPGFAPLRFGLVPNTNHSVPVQLAPLAPVPQQVVPTVVPVEPQSRPVQPRPQPAQRPTSESPTSDTTRDNLPAPVGPSPANRNASSRTTGGDRGDPTRGTLMVTSATPCQVSVDGHPAGTTPARISLAEGEHVVRCLTPPARMRTHSVTVTAGQFTTASFD